MVIENNGRMILWGEPEEDGVIYFMLEELSEGELFWGEIPYDELKKFSPGMVNIDPDTLELTAVPID